VTESVWRRGFRYVAIATVIVVAVEAAYSVVFWRFSWIELRLALFAAAVAFLYGLIDG
jgi:hypothetical protein